MDQIKALNSSVGAAIMDVLQPTFSTFAPLLLQNKEAILSIPRREESYGPHPRQKLDIYLAPQTPEKSPILVFFYGGGLVLGDKIVTAVPEGLLYHNLGCFFAARGITTIIPDYRRVNSPFGGEDAVFPSGGEDVALVLKWLEGFSRKGSGDVFVMGNSAGGLHLSTFLLAPQFLQQRTSLAAAQSGITLRGAIELGVPFHFKADSPELQDTLLKYYGSAQEIEERCPYGLLEAVGKTGMSREETGVPKLLLLLAEFDPVKEIEQPMRDFATLLEKTWGAGWEFKTIKGHNHISPPVALMSGDDEGEQWGEDLAEWIKSLSSK